MDVRITFSEVDMTTTFTDLLESGEVRVVVTYPDEIPRDLGRSLKLSSDWMLSIPARTDLFGKIMQGTYTVLVERYNVGGTVLQTTETVTFDLSYEDLPVTVGESWDVFMPSFRLTDTTVYTRPNFLTTAPLDRLWTARNGTHEWSLASLSFLTLYDGGYFTGDYEWSLDVNVTSTMDNDYVVLITKEVVSGTKTINLPPMLEEIYALMGCLFGKMKAKECCKDASYERMKSDYIYASSLLFNFVLGGQAGNTTQLADMLNGTDCQDGILTILKRWGCYDDTITDTAISAYDFCLCSSPSVPPTGDTYLEPMYHDAGNECIIRTDGYTDPDANWQFLNTFGQGRFILGPNQVDVVKIYGGRVFGDASISTYNSNGATDSFLLRIPFITYDGSNDVIINEYQVPEKIITHLPQVWSKSGDLPTENAPWVLDTGSVQVRFVGLDQSGVLLYVFAGIGATYPNGWMITFTTP